MEKMTMYECFDVCDDNDYPFIKGGFNDLPNPSTKKEILNKDSTFISLNNSLSDQWEIKKSELNILRPEQYCYDFDLNSWGNSILGTLYRGFNDGDKNGQIREWLRPEQVELRRCVEEFFIEPSGVNFAYHKLQNAFENLKPPY